MKSFRLFFVGLIFLASVTASANPCLDALLSYRLKTEFKQSLDSKEITVYVAASKNAQAMVDQLREKNWGDVSILEAYGQTYVRWTASLRRIKLFFVFWCLEAPAYDRVDIQWIGLRPWKYAGGDALAADVSKSQRPVEQKPYAQVDEAFRAKLASEEISDSTELMVGFNISMAGFENMADKKQMRQAMQLRVKTLATSLRHFEAQGLQMVQVLDMGMVAVSLPAGLLRKLLFQPIEGVYNVVDLDPTQDVLPAGSER